LAKARLLRQWAGIADMTSDFSPVMGLTPVDDYFIDAGWGTWGFKATPVCGLTMAETVATGRPHSLIDGFRLDRFRSFQQVGERGAASVGH
ncbi:MAG: FAD-dependent oxidoreductase, partial [Hyphomicrobiales bacterium]|nr:FAD-dependent oxidoreductase [Hyphomicrobiales bacterium]